MTAAMEDLDDSIFFDKVPERWTKLAYPSTAGMSIWLADLINRIRVSLSEFFI